MNPEQIREQEHRLAALTYPQSPCQAFQIVPQDETASGWVEVSPGPEGETFLTYWMRADACRRLKSIGLSELEPGVWTLALDFGGDLWAAYTLRAMARSSWSGVVFPLAEMGKTWPEGVVLWPEEVDVALETENDLYGVVLPGESWTVLCFIANEYNEYELDMLGKRLLSDPFQRVAYLQDPSPLTGLPRPAFKLEFPKAAPLDVIQFLPPQPGLEIDPDSSPADRLFKDHWILRLLNPPEKERHHEPE